MERVDLYVSYWNYLFHSGAAGEQSPIFGIFYKVWFGYFPSTYQQLQMFNLLRRHKQLPCQSEADLKEDNDVWEERMRVDSIVNDKDQLNNCSLVCNRIRFREVVPINCVSFKIRP